MPTNIDYKSAAIQALRVFIAGFIALYPVTNIIGAASGSQPVDVAALRAAAASGIIAAIMFVWRAYVDKLPVPTLVDRNPTPTPPAP